MNSRGGLARDDGARIRPGAKLDQLGIAVHQAGGGIEQKEQRRLIASQLERRKDVKRHLLIAGCQPGPPGISKELQTHAANPAGGTARQLPRSQLGRRQEIRGRDASCWRTH
jgi:hypothetical protein